MVNDYTNMRKLFIDEILELVNKCKTDAEKVVLLKRHDTLPLRQVAYANFSQRINFLLPDGPTPFMPSNLPSDLAMTTIYKEIRKFYMFVQIGNSNISQIRRESLWVQILESLSAAEAEVLENLKSKNLEKRYGLTLKSVQDAFPDLLKPVDIFQPAEDKLTKPKARKRGRKPKSETIE